MKSIFFDTKKKRILCLILSAVLVLTTTYSMPYTEAASTSDMMDLEVTIDSNIEVLAGTDYDLTKFVHVPSDYDGSISIDYYSGSTALSAKPKVTGWYSFKVIAEPTSHYNEYSSSKIEYHVAYLDAGVSASLSGIVNGHYAKEKVTVSAPSGYKILFNYGGYDDYVSSFDVGEDVAYSGSSLCYTLRRESDNAETDYIYSPLSKLSEITFDSVSPELSPYVGSTPMPISNGEVVVGGEIEIEVDDPNLAKVTFCGETYTEGFGDGVKNVFMTAVKGSPQTLVLYAEDYSGNSTSLEFTLMHPDDYGKPTATPTATPTSTPTATATPTSTPTATATPIRRWPR